MLPPNVSAEAPAWETPGPLKAPTSLGDELPTTQDRDAIKLTSSRQTRTMAGLGSVLPANEIRRPLELPSLLLRVQILTHAAIDGTGTRTVCAMVGAAMLHWRAPHERHTHFLSDISGCRRRKRKGKQPVRLESYAATNQSGFFAGYAALPRQDDEALQEAESSDDEDAVVTTPLAGEPGPSNWRKRQGKLADAHKRDSPGKGVQGPDTTKLAGRLKTQPKSLKKTPATAEQDELEKLKRKDFDTLKPTDRAKVRPKHISDDGFYRGFSPWRELGVEARLKERFRLKEIMRKFSWRKAWKRSRGPPEPPLSPRSLKPESVLGQVPELPELANEHTSSAHRDAKGARAVSVQVGGYDVISDTGSADGDSKAGADPAISSTGLPVPAMNFPLAEPAHSGKIADSSDSSASITPSPHDSARQSGGSRGSRSPWRLSTAVWKGNSEPATPEPVSPKPTPTPQSLAARWEKLSSGTPVRESGDGVRVKLWQAKWGRP